MTLEDFKRTTLTQHMIICGEAATEELWQAFCRYIALTGRKIEDIVEVRIK